MKFAQYLRDTQTPEWKKAYIDYRGLKKRITAIRKAQLGQQFMPSPDDSHAAVPATPIASEAGSNESLPYKHIPRLPPLPASPASDRSTRVRRTPSKPDEIATSSAVEASGSEPRKGSIFGGKSSRIFQAKSGSSRRGTPGRPTNPLMALPLHDLLAQLSPHEVSFFTMLDAELDKVEAFYLSREMEMLSRGKMLEEQLRELNEHRKLFLQSHAKIPWASNFAAALKPGKKHLKATRTISISEGSNDLDSHMPTRPRQVWDSIKNRHEPTHSGMDLVSPSLSKEKAKAAPPEIPDLDTKEEDENHEHFPIADPENYLSAKRKLKKAVIEHYRGLELLHNYRVLNITGFRKALKKFEKVTKIAVQNQYMSEKVEKSAFASDKAIRQMMKEMEDMYAIAFVHGNKKKATKRLRGGVRVKSHHFSTFRSGILMGLAVPALVSGLVHAFRPETRQALPGWGALMLVYATLLIPTLFLTLVGLNLLVWARSRINYIFIFELNIMTCLDYREYFEIPSILLAGLAYAFWLSFARIGAPSVSPSVWPLVWLGATAVILFDPLPALFRSTRFWLVKVVAKLFASGTRHVEFTDFWMGDQFCSLVFPLSHLYFLVCVYVDGFSEDWRKCGASSKHWPITLVLATLPFLIRLIQSVKRYYDSRLVTHLINGGKYGSGLVTYFFYFLWRHQGTQRTGALFAIWCFASVVYTVYASTWDFLMDWSVLRLHSPNILLRPELVYTNHIPLYYCAIILNVLMRFAWVMYIPEKGPDMNLRTFIVAVLEMFRRWQWNFYRLENEHLGNMDQYRVTREVPLPYLFDDPHREDDREDEEGKDL